MHKEDDDIFQELPDNWTLTTKKACVRPQSGPLEWPVFPLIVGPNMLHAPRLVHRDNVFSVLTHHFLRKNMTILIASKASLYALPVATRLLYVGCTLQKLFGTVVKVTVVDYVN